MKGPTKQIHMKIILDCLTRYLNDPIRKEKIINNWIAGGQYFYKLMTTIFISPTVQYVLWIRPKNDSWYLQIDKRTIINSDEKQELIENLFDNKLDLEFNMDYKKTLCESKYWKTIMEELFNICTVRLSVNPKLRTNEKLENDISGQIEHIQN